MQLSRQQRCFAAEGVGICVRGKCGASGHHCDDVTARDGARGTWVAGVEARVSEQCINVRVRSLVCQFVRWEGWEVSKAGVVAVVIGKG